MTGITREDVAKVIRSVIEDAVWSDDDRLDNVGVDGPCDLLAVADAVMLLLHAPARIDEAVAKERERIRDAIQSAIMWLPVRAEADAYEFIDDAGTTLHTPSADERAMLEDFGHGLIGSLYTNLCITGVLPTPAISPTPTTEEGA